MDMKMTLPIRTVPWHPYDQTYQCGKWKQIDVGKKAKVEPKPTNRMQRNDEGIVQKKKKNNK